MSSSQKDGNREFLKVIRRRLQQTGGASGSIVVTLPKDWIRDLKLGAGDDVNIVREPDNRLSIYPTDVAMLDRGSRTLARIEVPEDVQAITNLSGNTLDEKEEKKEKVNLLERQIISAYLIGFNQIELEGSISLDVREDLLEFTSQRLLGLILSHAEQGKTMFKMYAPPTMTLDTAFKAVKEATQNIFAHLLELIKASKYDSDRAWYIHHADLTIARHYFYIVRLLKAAVDNPGAARERLNIRSGRDILGARVMIMSIERISNHAKKISGLLKTVDLPLEKELRDALAEGVNTASKSFSSIMEAFPLLGKADFRKANVAIFEATRKRNKMLEIRDHHERVKNDAVLRIIVESVGRMCEYTNTVGEMVLNLTIEDLLVEQSEDH